MAATLTIRDESLTGQPLHEWALDLLTDRVTVRELIRSRVYQEVQDHNLRKAGAYRGLVTPASEEDTLNGPRPMKPIDWRAQFAAAVEAFEANRVLILVGDRQLSSLEDVVEVAPATAVTFLRLVPLVGG